MGFDFFQFHAVAHDLDLVVDAPQAMEYALCVAHGQIARAVPACAAMLRKALRGEFRGVQVAQRQLHAANGQLTGLPVGKCLSLLVDHCGSAARQYLPDSDHAAPLGDHKGFALDHAKHGGFGGPVEVDDGAVRRGAVPGLYGALRQLFAAENRQAQGRQAARCQDIELRQHAGQRGNRIPHRQGVGARELDRIHHLRGR